MVTEMASAETADHTHAHTQARTNTRWMVDTSIRSRIGARCLGGADEQFWGGGGQGGEKPELLLLTGLFHRIKPI